MDPDLSIIIVNWNTRDLLARCIKSVYDTVMDLNFEVILVDNASTDRSNEMVRQSFPNIYLIENSVNVGFARANNQAIKFCNGRYILFLNSDTVVLENAILKMVQFMDQHPNVGITGPQLLYPNGKPQLSHGAFPTLILEFVSQIGLDKLLLKFSNIISLNHHNPYKTGYINGSTLLIRKKTIMQVGELDERFFMFSEEIDLCKRVQNGGWEIYFIPDSKIIHLEGGSTDLNVRRISLLYSSKLLYFEKYYGKGVAYILFNIMKFTTRTKIVFYRIISPLSLIYVEKVNLWQEVIHRLMSNNQVLFDNWLNEKTISNS
jgi:GT2 family glycosyltransferase